MKLHSRRDFLKCAVTASLGVALPRSRRSHEQADVAIVGAGISGLAAAHQLQRSGLNSFLVLDARGQVGGRILNQVVAGKTVEGGGEWIGPTHTAMASLIADLGLQTFKTYDEGRELFAIGARVVEGGGTAGAEFDDVKALLNEMALQVPLDAPWRAPHALVFDSISLDDWLSWRGASRDVHVLFDKVTWSILGALAADISFLYFLFYIHSSGNLDERLAVTGGAQESRIVGGPQLVPIRLAELLGDRVVTGSAVRQIFDAGNKVVIVSDHRIVEAKRVIVAMAPADANRIQFSPALPSQRQGLMQYWPVAKVFKGNVAYASPFWRSQGLKGQVSSVGTIYSVFDNSPPDGSCGILEVFAASGALAVRRNTRFAQIKKTLSAYFGPQANQPIGYVEKDWGGERWISGCVSPLGPKFLTTYGPALRATTGHIHWAGAETAAVWNGKMEGAVRAGQGAALDVLAVL